jgi:hypothetical protein
VRISLTIDPPFPLDIDVRTPKTMKWRLEEGDSFLREVIERGNEHPARSISVGR